jgi:hypothetical protein
MLGFANQLFRLSSGAQDVPRFTQENLTRGGEQHGARSALEQPDAQLLFQSLYLRTQRGLRHPQSFCRTAKIQLLRHRHKIAQMSQFHNNLILLIL